MNLIFRPVEERDYNTLAELYSTSLKDNKDGFIQDISYHGSIKDIAISFNNNGGGIYVLENNSSIIGMGGLSKVDTNTIELCKLHVNPNFKGLGLGKKISLELIKEAKLKGFKIINLHVTKTQKPAISLYKKLNFVEYKTHLYKMNHKSVDLTFDTVFMEKEL